MNCQTFEDLHLVTYSTANCGHLALLLLRRLENAALKLCETICLYMHHSCPQRMIFMCFAGSETATRLFRV
jgi:hypothetical protein